MQTVKLFVDDLLPSTIDAQPVIPTFTEFKHTFWPGYQHVAHQAALDAVLTQVAEYVLSDGQRGIKQAMIFMPPRHGKTRSVSRLFPPWLLACNPAISIIMASYGALLAARNSRSVRNLIQLDTYQQQFPYVQISEDTASKSEWDTTADGGVIAAGVGGGITGHGAKLAIIDDVVKSRAVAESEVYRERAIDWYTNDLLTRVEEPGGAIVLMMTRWHAADLAGYLLDNEPDKWHILSLPAIAGDDDAIGRESGTALWPERYPLSVLEDRREKMGEYAFNSVYQQSPLPSKGGLFDTGKIEIIDHIPECTEIVRFYDLAVTAKKHSDYTAAPKLGVLRDETLVILDMYRVQKVMPDVEADIIQNAAIDGRGIRIRMEAEKAGIVQLDYLLRRPELRGYTLDAKAPVGDKYTRAQPFASRVNAGKVKMLRGIWNRALLDEMAVFPMGAHDDQIDALSGAYEMLVNSPILEYSNTTQFYHDYRGV
jgi:predicted phage terminase large subunit-like protein